MAKIDALAVGQQASLTRIFSQQDVATFAAISGDANPVHLDAGYAATTVFQVPIVHGILTAGLISAVIGMQLPGLGAIYLNQTLGFKRPVYVGDAITARVTITELKAEKGIVVLQTQCFNSAGQLVIDGSASIKVY
ncbi:MAG: MaoC family dehydratase [Janthinobacterium lividum]